MTKIFSFFFVKAFVEAGIASTISSFKGREIYILRKIEIAQIELFLSNLII